MCRLLEFQLLGDEAQGIPRLCWVPVPACRALTVGTTSTTINKSSTTARAITTSTTAQSSSRGTDSGQGVDSTQGKGDVRAERGVGVESVEGFEGGVNSEILGPGTHASEGEGVGGREEERGGGGGNGGLREAGVGGGEGGERWILWSWFGLRTLRSSWPRWLTAWLRWRGLSRCGEGESAPE